MRPEDRPPQRSALVTCSCCWKAYRYSGDQIGRGTPAQNPACARGKAGGSGAKSEGALLVAASIVAAIRLRGEAIHPSPKLTSTVRDSVQLARLVLAETGTSFHDCQHILEELIRPFWNQARRHNLACRPGGQEACEQLSFDLLWNPSAPPTGMNPR